MKYISIFIMAILSSCSMIPFLAEEAKDLVEFEQDAIIHEIELRELNHNDNEKTSKTKATV